MFDDMASLAERLYLSESELLEVPKMKSSPGKNKKPEIGTFFERRYSSEDARYRLRSKVRDEAVMRLVNKESQQLPTDEQIQEFYEQLKANVSLPIVDDIEMVRYSGYRAALRKASEEIRKFLSVKLFVDHHTANKEDPYARVPIDAIIEYIQTKKRKIEFLLGLMVYDSSYMGFLNEEELREYIIENLLPRVPSLASIADDASSMRDYYLCMAMRKFLFFLDQKNQKKVPILDIVASGFLEEFLSTTEPKTAIDSAGDDQPEPEETLDSLDWFSRANCIRIQDLYMQLDKDGNGLLSYSEMENFQEVSNVFIERIFEMRQTYDGGQIDLRGFCDFLLAIENKSDVSSLNYYFHLLDVDGDGLLTTPDLHFFYREIEEMFRIKYPDEVAPLFEDIRNEIFDMCRPKNPAGISLKELISSGKGGTIVGILTDLNALLEYESRENNIGGDE